LKKSGEDTKNQKNDMDVSCLIAYHNEGNRIGKVLSKLKKVKHITEFVCVDDGSTDSGSSEVERVVPYATSIKLHYNTGKTNAIRVGLQKVTKKRILLFDADIFSINPLLIDQAIETSSGSDMVLFARYPQTLRIKINRFDTIYVGERLVKTDDLTKILSQRVSGFQLEIAINTYMQRHKKLVTFVQTPHLNIPKKRKFGLWQGMRKDYKMFWEMFTYNPYSYLVHLVVFGKKRLM
jgi:glycosyltransferase involved in cell wall biosynthesis